MLYRLALSFILIFIASSLMASETKLEAGMTNPGFHDKPSWFKDSFLDLREDIEEAAAENKRVILYFYQDGCPYCAKLLNDNFGNRDISKKTQDNFEVIAINMWGDKEVADLAGEMTTEKSFASALRVQYTPTLLMLNEAGKVLLRINGYFEPHKFSLALDFVSGHEEVKQSFRDYYAKHLPTAATGKIHKLAESLTSPLKLKDNLQQSFRPLVVMFEQKVCSACDELHEDILKRPLVAYALTEVDVAVVDMWSKDKIQTPDGRELTINDWANELDVKYAPSMVFFDKAGNEVFRTEAYLKTFHTLGAIDYVVSGAYKHQPNFQRYLKHRTDQLHARGFEVDFLE